LRTTLLTRLALAIAKIGTEKHMVLVIGHTISPFI